MYYISTWISKIFEKSFQISLSSSWRMPDKVSNCTTQSINQSIKHLVVLEQQKSVERSQVSPSGHSTLQRNSSNSAIFKYSEMKLLALPRRIGHLNGIKKPINQSIDQSTLEFGFWKYKKCPLMLWYLFWNFCAFFQEENKMLPRGI